MTAPTFDTQAGVRKLRDAGLGEQAAESVVEVVGEATSPLVTRDALKTCWNWPVSSRGSGRTCTGHCGCRAWVSLRWWAASSRSWRPSTEGPSRGLCFIAGRATYLDPASTDGVGGLACQGATRGS